jgi:putative endonuclease
MITNRYNNVLYTGVTNDLLRRMYEHRNHLIKDSFTARYNLTKLVYFEVSENARTAIEREKQIKSWNRKRKNALVESQNPTWEDQYPMIL